MRRSSPASDARRPSSSRGRFATPGGRLYSFGIYAASVALVLVVWELASRRFGLLVLFPPPTNALRRVVELLLDGTLEAAATVSIMRIISGFLVGSALGTVIGILMGTSRVIRMIVEPYMNFFRFIPPLAWFAPVLLVFGTGEVSKELLIVYTTVFVVAINAMDGVASVSRNKVRMAKMFGASKRQLFADVTLPGSMPFILTGMRLAMGNAFMTIVASEMLAANDGLGYLLLSSQIFYDVSGIFAGCIALGALGFATDRLFRWLSRRWGARYLADQSLER